MAIGDENSQNSTLTVRPDVLAWRGRFTIPNRNIDINLRACKSSKAGSLVLDIANVMPDHLCLEMRPLDGIWPDHLNKFQATEFTIDLFFISEERDNDVLNRLLNDVVSTHSALKAVIVGGVELLIFTSLQLPETLQKLDGKLYFWGLFTKQSASSSSHESQCDDGFQNIEGQLDSGSAPSSSRNLGVEMRQLCTPDTQTALNSNKKVRKRKGKKLDDGIQNNEGTLDSGSAPSSSRNLEVEIRQLCTPDTDTAFEKNNKAKKRKGRKLDDGWEHALCVDDHRCKTKCKYCGFISKSDGISRMKAHLSGQNPRVPSCDEVSPEIRKQMADWYHVWSKNTKAKWVTADYQGIDLSKSMSFDVEKTRKSEEEMANEQRAINSVDYLVAKKPGIGKTHDAWSHAVPLDPNGFTTKCRHCGFISELGGISRLKVHLSGESPLVPACEKVPKVVKQGMACWFHKWKKTANFFWMMESQGDSEPIQASKRQLQEVDAREHVIRMDKNGQHIKCKHCNFVPKHRGIDCMIVHLAGGDPRVQLQGCPNVSREVKSLLFKQLNNSTKKTKHTNMAKTGM